MAIYPDRGLVIIVASNYITYRMLVDRIPITVELPATELREALARNIASGDFASLPRRTFSIYPYATGEAAAFLSLVALALAWRRRRQRSTQSRRPASLPTPP